MRITQMSDGRQKSFIRLGSGSMKQSSNSDQRNNQIDLKLDQPAINKNQLNNSMLSQNKRLQNILQNFIGKVKSLNKQSKNINLVPFFQKAGTNQTEVTENLNKLQQIVQDIQSNLKYNQYNNFIVESAFSFLVSYLGQNKLQQLTDIQKAVIILDLQFKAICCLDLLKGSLTLPDDITTLPKQKFTKVWECVKFQKCGDQAEVSSQMSYMKKIMAITTSAVLNEHQKTGAFTKVVAFGLSYPQYYFSDYQSIFRSMNFYRKPTIQMAQSIWNLPQNGLTKQITKLSLKSIQSNIKIYIPFDDKKLPQDIFQYNPEAIKVRLLYNDTIHVINKKTSLSLFCCGSPNFIPKDITSIIIHFHGGGFVALSSRSMQTYTRKWARELKTPVFSIDYRKPPSYRFPTAPFDCLTVYSFLVNHIHKYFNINPQKIILAGDSAGGNLACSLMGLILKYKLPSPYGIFLAYPACDLRKIFSPSRTFSFSDPLLNPPMLMLCLRQYLNDRQEYEHDPIASPILLTQDFIKGTKGNKNFPKEWPQTIIQVGAKDPLFDDSLRLLQKLVSSGIKCNCQVYQNLSHGFLSLDFVVSACSQTIKDSIEHLRKLLI